MPDSSSNIQNFCSNILLLLLSLQPMLYALLESSFVSLFAFYVAAELENSAIVIAVQQGLFIWTAFDLVKTHWGQRMLVDTRYRYTEFS